jgi:hypothetical protein
MADVEDGVGDGRLAAGVGEPAGAALERRHALLEHIRGRVHDPRVDVAELLQGEEVGGVLGVAEDVAGGLVDGHGPCAGGGVGFLAGVEGERAEARGTGRGWGGVFVGHGGRGFAR